LSLFLSPKKNSPLKDTPYECGEEPVGSAWSAFNIRFYVVGLIFIIFDVLIKKAAS
jgi:NADH-quinone oxidoreductase subunit A